jgi:hypothetical protein
MKQVQPSRLAVQRSRHYSINTCQLRSASRAVPRGHPRFGVYQALQTSIPPRLIIYLRRSDARLWEAQNTVLNAAVCGKPAPSAFATHLTRRW